LPSNRKDYVQVFEGDSLAIEWGKIKNPPSVKGSIKIDCSPIKQSDVLTYVGLHHESRLRIFCGTGPIQIKEGAVYYGISTGNGSCGNGLFRSQGGSYHLCAFHSGTRGGVNQPNYSYILKPASLN